MLSSIFNQSFKDFELILIDDGSTDGSERICRQASLNKKVTLIASSSDIGKSKVFNSGLNHARGEYVLFLSGNDLIFSEHRALALQNVFVAGGGRDLLRATA